MSIENNKNAGETKQARIRVNVECPECCSLMCRNEDGTLQCGDRDCSEFANVYQQQTMLVPITLIWRRGEKTQDSHQ